MADGSLKTLEKKYEILVKMMNGKQTSLTFLAATFSIIFIEVKYAECVGG